MSVFGVINKKSRAKKDEIDLILMTMDESRNTYTKRIKVPSNFNFDLEDIYGNEQDIVIQSSENWDKDHKKYTIAIENKKPLPVSFNYDDKRAISDSLITTVVTKNRAQKNKKMSLILIPTEEQN